MNLLKSAVILLVFVPVFGIVTSFRNHLAIDDILNSDLTLFPNITLSHQVNFEEEVLERFKKLLEDDSVLNKAYDTFQVFISEQFLLYQIQELSSFFLLLGILHLLFLF